MSSDEFRDDEKRFEEYDATLGRVRSLDTDDEKGVAAHNAKITTAAAVSSTVTSDTERPSEAVPRASLASSSSQDLAARACRHPNTVSHDIAEATAKLAHQTSALLGGDIQTTGLDKNLAGTRESMVVLQGIVQQHMGLEAKIGDEEHNFGAHLVAHKLMGGGLFVKHGKRGINMRYVWLSEDLVRIHWGESKKFQRVSKGYITVHDLQGVFEGFSCPTSIAFSNKQLPESLEPRCFSLQTSTRTLDLECASHMERDLWMVAFRHLFRAYHNKTVMDLVRRKASHSLLMQQKKGQYAEVEQKQDVDYMVSSMSEVLEKHPHLNDPDPLKLSHQTLVNEVLAMRSALEQSIPRAEVRKLQLEIEALLAEWHDARTEERAIAKREIVNLRKQLADGQNMGSNRVAGSDRALPDGMSDAGDTASVAGSTTTRASFFAHGNAQEGEVKRLQSKVAMLEKIARVSNRKLERSKETLTATNYKLRRVIEENNELKKSLGLAIASLSAPHDGPEVIRSMQQFEKEKEFSAGYLSRQLQRLTDGSVTEIPVEELVKEASQTDLHEASMAGHSRAASVASVGLGYGAGYTITSNIGLGLDPDQSVAGTRQHSRRPSAHSIRDGATATSVAHSTASKATVNLQRNQLGIVGPLQSFDEDVKESKDDALSVQGDDSNAMVITDPENVLLSDPSSVTETNLELTGLFASLRVQWERVNNLIENKEHGAVAVIWEQDDAHPHCQLCQVRFTLIRRRHHCRMCGGVFCGSCTAQKTAVKVLGTKEHRLCYTCFGNVRALDAARSMLPLPSAQIEDVTEHKSGV